jgi:phage shock protein C
MLFTSTPHQAARGSPAHSEKGRYLMGSIQDRMREQGFTRPSEGRILGGVCAGLGRKLGLDPGTARLLFVIVLVLLPGSPLIIYPILWYVMPPSEPAQPGAPAGFRPSE